MIDIFTWTALRPCCFVQIWLWPLLTNQQLITFPVLESLTLCVEWSNLLIIAYRDGQVSKEEPMSTLRQTTVRPMSLSTNFVSDTYLPELLELWSDLSELHLRGSGNACIPGPIATVVLAGSDVAAPLCSSLRYLTVHIEQNQKDLQPVNQSTQKIVEERKSHGAGCLQHVMCVWEYWEESDTIYHKALKERRLNGPTSFESV
jgi:hypothetical protein